ncbi:MAG: PAAR domain-containing protein [Pseudomonas sp.]|uniref:PAAR domain-containing protein n=1 Tax=Pseudomonas sp. TaxID=306 RepID=UPI003D6F97A9
MSKGEGYFIGQGDKTTCGGVVLDGDPRINMFGVLHACEGDRVTCGVDGQTYRIVGGISYMNSHGRLMAGTLDSRSDCSCRAQLIPSVYTMTYGNDGPATQASSRAVEPSPSTVTRRPVASQQSSFAPSRTPTAFGDMTGQEPGFYIVPKSMTRQALEATLFSVHKPDVMSKFHALNPGRGDLKAGSMIVLSDPYNFQCSREEAWLMEAAAKTNDALGTLSANDADFMVRHYAEISTFLSHASTSIGIGEAMFANHLKNVESVLQEIDALHKRTFQTDGHLRSPAFFTERKRLLTMLDTSLNGMTRKSIGFPDHPNLKSALGISSRSLVHQWTKAGASGQIPGYATHIEGVAKASKYIKYGGWIGTAVGGGASYIKVQDVCTAGNSETCEKVKFTETGGFTGSVVGGALAGGLLSSSATGFLCAALGVPTGGVSIVVCGIVAVGAGSYAGGTLGQAGGERIGEKIFESVK